MRSFALEVALRMTKLFMTTLHLDTSKTNETIIAVEKDGQKVEKKSVSETHRSQSVLPLIEELLKEQNLTLQDLTGITLMTGPGSFTGLRVGAAIAGTLSLLLNIPINGNPPGTIPELNYGKDLWGLKK